MSVSIHPIILGVDHCYLLQGDGMIMIDVGEGGCLCWRFGNEWVSSAFQSRATHSGGKHAEGKRELANAVGSRGEYHLSGTRKTVFS